MGEPATLRAHCDCLRLRDAHRAAPAATAVTAPQEWPRLHPGRIGDRKVIAVVTGMGTALARAGTVRLLNAVEVEWVIVVGITGAIENQTSIGTLVLPEVVIDGGDGSQHRPTPLPLGRADGAMWTTDELLLDPAVHADLRARGVISLDMERPRSRRCARTAVCHGRWCERSATGPVTAVWTPTSSASATRTAP